MALKELDGEIVLTRRRKSGKQNASADEARGHASIVIADFFREALTSRFAEFLWKQVHVKSQGVGGLRIDGELRFGLDILFVESGFDVGEKLVVFGSFFGLAEGTGHFRHEPG